MRASALEGRCAAAVAPQGRVLVGISGWRYAPWRGVFYPPDVTLDRELEFAARTLPSIEINGSFYSLQRPTSYAARRGATPTGFVFSVKGSRYITHMLRLANVGTALANFFASGVLALDEKLGPVLWQLPGRMPLDLARLAGFLELLPRDTSEALTLARSHDERLAGRSHLAIDSTRPLRHALEVRHESYGSPALLALLRRHNVAMVVADTAQKFPFFDETTADFAYARLHGDTEVYRSGYSDEALERWAERIRACLSLAMCMCISTTPRRCTPRSTPAICYACWHEGLQREDVAEVAGRAVRLEAERVHSRALQLPSFNVSHFFLALYKPQALRVSLYHEVRSLRLMGRCHVIRDATS